MSEHNYWTSWLDDEGDRRECGPLTLESADELAQQTSGWVDGFDMRGNQVMIVSYWQPPPQLREG